jgi:hypothetical protein
MDPDSNIREQLEIAEEINSISDAVDPDTGRYTIGQLDDLADKALRLAELVEALNTWLMRGGYLPVHWGTRCPDLGKHERMRG